jgi:hypothetical protein
MGRKTEGKDREVFRSQKAPFVPNPGMPLLAII